MKQEDLIPVDYDRCQCEEHNGAHALTVGGKSAYVRCDKRPLYVVTESKPGADGVIGSMSLCEEHHEVLTNQAPAGYFSSKPINRGEAWA